MSLNVALIRDSFELVIERNPSFTARFYEILFERHPAVRQLFGRNSARAQEEMLTRALVAAGVHSSSVFAAAFGSEQPVSSNADDEGRARNRRVEIAPVPKPSKSG